MERFDILVIGAGPAGAAAAIEAARSGARTMVVAGRRRDPPIGEVLGPEAVRELEALRVAPDGEGFTPIYAAALAWRSDRLEFRDHMIEPAGRALACDRARLDRTLARAVHASGATVRIGRASPSRHGSGWRCAIKSGGRSEVVAAAAVVAATGRGGFPDFGSGTDEVVRLDRLVGIARRWRLAADADFKGMTLLEAAPAGWWFLCQTGDGVAVATFFTDLDLLPRERIGKLAAMEVAAGDTRHLRTFLGDALGAIGIRDAGTLFRQCVSGPGWQAAGDAVSALDPLTGFGIAKALREGRSAAAQLLRGPAVGADITSIERDRANYLRQRRSFYAIAAARFETPFWRRRRPCDRDRPERSPGLI